MQQREIRVFDDSAEGWERLVRRDSRYATWGYTDACDVVAAAIRSGDGPMLHWPAES